MPIRNPYNIDFQQIEQVKSLSHDHGGYRDIDYDRYVENGFRHFAWSEYGRVFPDDPVFPEDFYGSGPYFPASRWGVDLFDEDSTLIETPCGEHVSTGGTSGHIIALGCPLGSIGLRFQRFPGVNFAEEFDIWLGDEETGEPFVFPGRLAFIDYLAQNMQFQDAGVIYQAHSANTSAIIQAIDHNPAFVGSDMYNDRRDSNNQKESRSARGYSIVAWDEVLRTGRRCWGFCEADRGLRGCNVLLVDTLSNYTAQKAYREGQFYCKLNQAETGLKFTKIEATDTKFEVETTGATNGIRLISEKGVIATSSGNSISYDIPQTAGGEPDVTYIRAEAFGPLFTDTQLPDPEWPVANYATGFRYDDEIYSQAVTYKNQQMVERELRKAKILRYAAAGLV